MDNLEYSSGRRRFAFNFVPRQQNPVGLRLLFNNNRFTLTSSNKGAVATTAAASRAYNKGCRDTRYAQ